MRPHASSIKMHLVDLRLWSQLLNCADLFSVAVRQPPMRVNLRARDLDCAGPLVVRENQSRRDLTKVAQYEVLG